ncbi:MAG: hypothetical protein J6S95_08720 [Lachnospiraceae bacterium]|nr:hypothetical protein [Lachnospiraceae bacterium]MBO7601212.1 hypothetical protein [Lachnospiraceae bacterium]
MNTQRLTKAQRSILIRRRELRRKKFILSILTALIFISVVSVFSMKSIASNGDTPELYKHYKNIYVTAEDSIYDIASEYADSRVTSEKAYIDEIIYMNNMESADFPVAGRFLIVPFYTTIQ